MQSNFVRFIKTCYFKLVVIPCCLFFIFVFSYASFSKEIPISYWDEMLWVGHSYFFDFFIKGDFSNPIWQSEASYDQPKLAEFSFGAWLYPHYFLDKQKSNEADFDYMKFLISRGLYLTDEPYADAYRIYHQLHNSETVNLVKTDNGFPDEYVARYGTNVLKTIHTIYQARIINFVYMALAVVMMFYIVYIRMGIRWAVIFSFLYGYNSLLIHTGIKAHSEALFVFLFNASLLSLLLYFLSKRKIFYLFCFSVLVGLCTSTKLNGSVLVICFFIINIFYLLFFDTKEKMIGFFHSFIPVIVVLNIFILLNPYTYADPVGRIRYEYEKRMETSRYYAQIFPDVSLPSAASRFAKFFSNFYITKDAGLYNAIYMLNIPGYSWIAFVLFLVGIFCEAFMTYKRKKVSFLIIFSFFISFGALCNYLLLNWPRYYVHMVVFIILFEGFGLYFFFQLLLRRTDALT